MPSARAIRSMLGGVRIPHTRGVIAHSDGDVVLHALCDAMLGAAGLGDIGMHFPDTDPVWKGAESRRFVAAVLEMLSVRKLKVGNADITLLAQSPKVSPYRLEIRRSMAQMLGVTENQVNIKATTTEHLGFIGRNEGLGGAGGRVVRAGARKILMIPRALARCGAGAARGVGQWTARAPASLRASPEDFEVDEILGFEASGAGPHALLHGAQARREYRMGGA